MTARVCDRCRSRNSLYAQYDYELRRSFIKCFNCGREVGVQPSAEIIPERPMPKRLGSLPQPKTLRPSQRTEGR